MINYKNLINSHYSEIPIFLILSWNIKQFLHFLESKPSTKNSFDELNSFLWIFLVILPVNNFLYHLLLKDCQNKTSKGFIMLKIFHKGDYEWIFIELFVFSSEIMEFWIRFSLKIKMNKGIEDFVVNRNFKLSTLIMHENNVVFIQLGLKFESSMIIGLRKQI